MNENKTNNGNGSLWDRASSIYAFLNKTSEKLIPSEELHQIHYNRKIFSNDNWSQVLLCFTNSASFDEKQFEAIKYAVKNLHENKLYYLALEITDRSDDYKFEEIEFSWNAYHNMNTGLFFQNIIFSDTLKWGVMLFYEDYGILGGEKKLIDRFKAAYPEWSQGKKHFTELWEEAHRHSGVDISWVPRFLASMD